ncbi:MAG: hypothetical protein ACFBSG_21250 [Leptolyngbyaceae cyanobacterium]
MTTESNKSFAEKNEEHVKQAINKVEEIATDDAETTASEKSKNTNAH